MIELAIIITEMNKTNPSLGIEDPSSSALKEALLDQNVRRSFLFEQEEPESRGEEDEDAPLRIQFTGTVIAPETMFCEHEAECLSKARGLNFANGTLRREYKLNPKLYAEFLSYHLLYFWVLGPLTSLILLSGVSGGQRNALGR